MNPLSPDWPQSAGALLDQAKNGGELVRLIMAGTHHLESWLIENRILPALQVHQLGTLRFEIISNDQGKRSAIIVPLPEGSAFACNTDGQWSALDADEALHEIEYIGSRYAPGDRWLQDFAASYQPAGNVAGNITPLETAAIWKKITGRHPRGFETGALDQMEAFGFGVIDRMLHVQNRLGL